MFALIYNFFLGDNSCLILYFLGVTVAVHKMLMFISGVTVTIHGNVTCICTCTRYSTVLYFTVYLYKLY